MNIITNPAEIELKSMDIINERLDIQSIKPQNINVIKRVIHTTADFDYVDNLVFSKGAMDAAKEAFLEGANIFTDTQMARAGINKKAAAKLGCEVHCYIDSEEVTQAAQRSGLTRSREAIDAAVRLHDKPSIFVIGNAPTALIRLYELIASDIVSPRLVVAVPVGFVNVVESKELIMKSKVPHIVSKGNKGGSNVAAAICNAIMYEIIGDKRDLSYGSQTHTKS